MTEPGHDDHDHGDYDDAAATVGDVVRRLEISIRLARAQYEQTFNPPRAHVIEMTEEQRERWRLEQLVESLPLSARWEAFGEALAVVMGWEEVEAQPDGMVQTLLEILEEEHLDEPLDVVALKARVEAHRRSWRGF